MGDVDTSANITFCNECLGMFGAEAIVLNTASQNRTYCELYFTNSLYEILSMHKWNFARKDAYAIQTTDPLFKWSYAYTKPSDCIRVWRIDNNNDSAYEVVGDEIRTDEGEEPPDYDEDGVDYLAGQYISSDTSGSDLTYLVDTAFTSSSEASDIANYCTSQGDDLRVLKVEYVYQYTTIASWPKYVRQCALYNLAVKLIPPIKQEPKTAVSFQEILVGSRKVTGLLDIARSMDAQEGGGEVIQTDTFLDSRK